MNRRILAIVLAVTLTAAGSQLAACKRLQKPGGSSAASTKVEIEAVVLGADPDLAKGFRVGDTVRVKDTGSVLGKIASVTTTPTEQAVPTSDGRLVVAEVPDQVDIHVFIAGTPVLRDDGYRFGGEAVWVNSELKLVTPLTYCEAIVLTMKETGK